MFFGVEDEAPGTEHVKELDIRLPVVKNLIGGERETFVEIRPVLSETSCSNGVCPEI